MSEQGQLLIAEVRRIAEAQPDFVYPGDMCYYMTGDLCEGSCIIGKALVNLGLLTKALHQENVIEGKSASVVFGLLGVQVDPNEATWLDCVQSAQDGRAFTAPKGSYLEPKHLDNCNVNPHRYSWGDAVKFADEYMKAFC